MDFGVNGYITHTISKIDDTSLALPEIAKYKKDGGKAKAADQGLVKLVKNLETYNYSSDLGEFVDNGKTYSKGRKYFTADYIYDDYSDEYLAYYKSTYNKELTRNGYLTFKIANYNSQTSNNNQIAQIVDYSGIFKPMMIDFIKQFVR